MVCDNNILNIQEIPEHTPYKDYSPKIGFIYDTDTLDALAERYGLPILINCGFKKQHRTEETIVIFSKRKCNLGNNGRCDLNIFHV